MEAIQQAFNESICESTPQPENKWWGYSCKDNHVIMLYNVIVLTFDKTDDIDILVSENKNNRAAIAHVTGLIKEWQKTKNDLLIYSKTGYCSR